MKLRYVFVSSGSTTATAPGLSTAASISWRIWMRPLRMGTPSRRTSPSAHRMSPSKAIMRDGRSACPMATEATAGESVLTVLCRCTRNWARMLTVPTGNATRSNTPVLKVCPKSVHDACSGAVLYSSVTVLLVSMCGPVTDHERSVLREAWYVPCQVGRRTQSSPTRKRYCEQASGLNTHGLTMRAQVPSEKPIMVNVCPAGAPMAVTNILDGYFPLQPRLTAPFQASMRSGLASTLASVWYVENVPWIMNAENLVRYDVEVSGFQMPT